MKKLFPYSLSNHHELKSTRMRPPFVAVLFCLLGIFIATTVSGQIPTNCGSVNCTSNDVRIERAYLTDLSNNPLSCVGTTPIANFRLHLVVSTKTPRHGVFINCKLNIISGATTVIPVSACFGVQLTGDNNDLTVDFTGQSLPCGSAATLTEVFTSWGTGSTPFCPGSCPETKSKCRFVPGEVIIVQTFPCTPATISAIADDTKCSGASKTFTATFSAGANTNITSVKWQIFNTGTSSWDDLSVTAVYTTVDNDNTSPATLTIGNVTGLNGKQYRLFVGSTSPSSGLTCSATEDATLTVDPATVGGSAVAGASPICTGTGTNITLSGHTGAIEKWQSNTSGTWVDVPSSAGVNPLSTGNLTATTQYRAVVKSGVCDAANSSPATVTVNAASVGGSTSAGASPICAGTGTTITLSGHTGTIDKWQYNTTGTWVDIASSAGVNPLNTGNLNTTSQFRAVVKSGVCDAVNSAPTTVTVDPASVGGSTSAGASPICAGSGTTITLSGHTGTIQKWQSNTTGTWVDIASSAGVNPLSTGNLNTTTQFRAVVKNGVCDAVNSAPTTVAVDAASVGGSTSAGASPICAGTGTTITLSGHTGTIQKWQSNTTGTWVDIPSSAGVNPLSTGNLNTTTQFRAAVKSGVCDAVNSAPTTVTVGDIPTLPAFTITQPSLCGTGTGSINFCTTLSGYTYKVGSLTPINGNGSGQSVGGLAAGSNPNIEVTNTTGGCKTTFTCSQSISECAGGGISSRNSSAINEVSSSQPTVKAYPNPFSDRIKFVITSPISGDGSLDVYNMMGQRVKTVYNGYIAEGTQIFELSLSTKQVANLVYVMRIGNKQMTGKILQINQ